RLSAAERAALPAAAFVETLAQALELAERFPAATFVTRGRELVRGSLVRATHAPAEASGPFALARQIEELSAHASRSREVFAAAEEELAGLRRTRQERESRLPQLREREREAGGRLSGVTALLQERRAARDRVSAERGTLQAEIEALRAGQQGLEAERRGLEETERLHAEAETQIRERAEAISALLPEARSFSAAAADELAHRRTEAEVAAERRRSAEAARQRHMENLRALERRAGDAAQEKTRLAERRYELAREDAQAAARLEENLAVHGSRSAELAQAGAAAVEAAARVDTGEQTSRSQRSVLDVAREGRFEAEMSESRVRSDLEHVEAQAREDFGVAPDELPAPADASEEGLAALEAEAAELSAAIERIGPVNVIAFEEYTEESRRLEFLTTQRDDLLRSIQELTDSIRKINVTSSERFRAAFTAINENFKAMFTRLFQGGTAEMRLLDENDLLESGVEIIAQPPGKRNQSILLLSGGEKALAAIALLMAIFRYKPSPFCILDEVDAPLDEANIDRFTRLLREMTEETQFIAITHNKRTMETADAMYGVTMEEPGCSKIVSVKFD
ncbi:MAG TPA: AAA family ATPase, partial [Thermoanaerobaculia bacterium]|nr:AAA family ATPase [Thermoanaerobaculia bacterium]